MKKIYAMGIALLAGASAMAAPQKAQMSESQVLKSETTVADVVAMDDAAKGSKVAGKAITDINQLAGLAKLSCKDVSGIGNKMNLLTKVEVKNANTIIFKNFLFSNNDCEATVNVAAGTVTFKRQTPLGQVNTQDGVVATYLYTNIYRGLDEDKKPIMAGVKEFSGKIMENGDIILPDSCAFVIGTAVNAEQSYSYFCCMTNNEFKNIPYNTPTDLSDWREIGIGTFNDGWFNPLLISDNIQPIEGNKVKVMKGISNPNRLLIVDPYADSQWEEFGRSGDGHGYLMVDVEYKDCCYVVPLVYSGMRIQYQNGTVEEYYLNNEIGLRVFNGADIEGIIEDNVIVGNPMSEIVGNTLSLIDLSIGYQDLPTGDIWWTDGNGPDVNGKYTFLPQIGCTVELPEGWAGIQGVAADVENAPVKYYNLQGVEISAPVKGQLTIKKQGNKSSKFIAR